MITIDAEYIGPVTVKQVLTSGGYYTIGRDSRMENVVALFFNGTHIDKAQRHFHRVIELACQDLEMYP